MTVSLAGRDFLKLLDFSAEEITYLIDLSAELKAKKKSGELHRYHEGKNIVLLFEKTSTRTRCSFEVGALDLGMGVTYLEPKSSQMGKKESIADTARVLSRFYDGIEYRGFAQEGVETLAEYASVPVWNGLTTEAHPTQMIADMLTIREHLGELSGLKVAFFGDAGNNVGNSLMVACAKLGINFTACGPRTQMPDDALVESCRSIAEHAGSTVTLTEDVAEGARGANAVYTDIWVSMGESDEVWAERIEMLSPYRVTDEVMDQAEEGALFMHCLPSYHDTNTEVAAEVAERFGVEELEVSNSVFESDASVVFDEAENRMHTIKAIMHATLADS